MKKVRLILVALCALVFAACSTKADSPSGVVKEYLNCVKAGEFEKAVNCFYFKEKVGEVELKALAQKLEQGYSKEGKLLKYEIVSEEVEKDEAGNIIKGKVGVKFFYENDVENEETITTIKDNGVWKIDFTVK